MPQVLDGSEVPLPAYLPSAIHKSTVRRKELERAFLRRIFETSVEADDAVTAADPVRWSLAASAHVDTIVRLATVRYFWGYEDGHIDDLDAMLTRVDERQRQITALASPKVFAAALAKRRHSAPQSLSTSIPTASSLAASSSFSGKSRGRWVAKAGSSRTSISGSTSSHINRKPTPSISTPQLKVSAPLSSTPIPHTASMPAHHPTAVSTPSSMVSDMTGSTSMPAQPTTSAKRRRRRKRRHSSHSTSSPTTPVASNTALSPVSKIVPPSRPKSLSIRIRIKFLEKETDYRSSGGGTMSKSGNSVWLGQGGVPHAGRLGRVCIDLDAAKAKLTIGRRRRMKTDPHKDSEKG